MAAPPFWHVQNTLAASIENPSVLSCLLNRGGNEPEGRFERGQRVGYAGVSIAIWQICSNSSFLLGLAVLWCGQLGPENRMNEECLD